MCLKLRATSVTVAATTANPAILLYGLTALTYIALAALLGRGERHGARTVATDIPAQAAPSAVSSNLRWWVLVPLTLHGFTLFQGLFAGATPRFGFGHALSVMLWLAVAFYWVESFFLRVNGLLALTLPIAALCALLPAAFPGFALKDTASIAFRLHLVMAMAAYSLFTIAMLQAVLMAALERRLHRGRASPANASRATDVLVGPLGALPPLLTLERVLFRLIGLGFALLTLTIASGVLFSEQLFGQALRVDHKSLFAVVSWFIFAALLIGRVRAGWRGRTALRWIFAGFVSLLLAYVGSRFVLEVVLQRTL